MIRILFIAPFLLLLSLFLHQAHSILHRQLKRANPPPTLNNIEVNLPYKAHQKPAAIPSTYQNLSLSFSRQFHVPYPSYVQVSLHFLLI